MSNYADDEPVIHRPKPRRPFELPNDSPSAPSTPITSPDHAAFPGKLDTTAKGIASGTTTPARTHSILNLTSSTLFGIYQPTESTWGEDTPFGSGAQTPAVGPGDSRHGSFDFTRARLPEGIEVTANGGYKRTTKAAVPTRPAPRQRLQLLPLIGREIVLLATGVLYGLLISHLHDRQQIAPVPIDIDRKSWEYLSVWAVVGVILGEALPLTDRLWNSHSRQQEQEKEDGKQTRASAAKQNSNTEQDDGAAQRRRKALRGWNEVVRSVCAFVGISFAIRKLPWQSTLQLSLTLALANPALWYLIDRSVPGFLLSSTVSIVGTNILLLLFPQVVPPPGIVSPVDTNETIANSTFGASSRDHLAVFGIFSSESVGVWTWIASVLFVSSVCFGNIGRQLTPRRRI